MTSDEEYQLELVQAERDAALRQVETLRAENGSILDELGVATAALGNLKAQLADAEAASDLNCHGWKECQAEFKRVIEENARLKDENETWHEAASPTKTQVLSTLKAELKRVTAERDAWRESGRSATSTLTFELSTLRQQLVATRKIVARVTAERDEHKARADHHEQQEMGVATDCYQHEHEARGDERAKCQAELTTLREQLAVVEQKGFEAGSDIARRSILELDKIRGRLATLDTAAREAIENLRKPCVGQCNRAGVANALERALERENGR